MEKPTFSPSFWLGLAVNNPLGRTDITEEDVRDWFDFVWPVYSEHRRTRAKHRHKVRVARWWLRVKPEDIDRSRARAEALRRSAANRRFEKRISDSPYPSIPPRTDIPPLRVSRGASRG